VCKPNQVMVSIAPSSLFDDAALAEVLGNGRMAAAWLDSVEPGLLDEGRPLHGAPNLHTSSRLAGYTQESRVRSVWTVAQRLDEILSQTPPVAREFRTSANGPLGPAAGPHPRQHGPVSGPAPLEGGIGEPTGAGGDAQLPLPEVTDPMPLDSPSGTAETERAPGSR
jgi:D-3-phosphoglycerate dehydrogenase